MFAEILYDRLDHFFNEIALDAASSELARTRVKGEPDFFLNGLGVFLFGDHALFQHQIQNEAGPFNIVLFVFLAVGYITGWPVGNARQAGAFSQGQVAHVFSVIGLCGCLDAIDCAAHGNGVQIVVEDVFLGKAFPLDLECLPCLLDLSFHGVFIISGQVFYHLLCYRAAALQFVFALQFRDSADISAFHESSEVHALMLPETLVFNGDVCVDQVLRDFRVVNPHAVFMLLQFGQGIAVTIINKGVVFLDCQITGV